MCETAAVSHVSTFFSRRCRPAKYKVDGGARFPVRLCGCVCVSQLLDDAFEYRLHPGGAAAAAVICGMVSCFLGMGAILSWPGRGRAELYRRTFFEICVEVFYFFF